MPFHPEAVTLDTAKRMSRRLRRTARTLFPEQPLAQHHALELVAAVLGFENWHTAQQALATPSVPATSPVPVAPITNDYILVERAGQAHVIRAAERQPGDREVPVAPLPTSLGLPKETFQFNADDVEWKSPKEDYHRFTVLALPRTADQQRTNRSSVHVIVENTWLTEPDRWEALCRHLAGRFDIEKVWSTSPDRITRVVHHLVAPVRSLLSFREAMDFVYESDRHLMRMGHADAPVFASKQAEKAQERRLTPLLFSTAQVLTLLRGALLERITPKEWAAFEKDCHSALNSDCKEEMARTDLKARVICQLYLVSKTWNYLATVGWWERQTKAERRALRQKLKEAVASRSLTPEEQAASDARLRKLRRQMKKQIREQKAAQTAAG